jgi:hypothetical protein
MELWKQTEEGKETEVDLLDKRVQKGEKGRLHCVSLVKLIGVSGLLYLAGIIDLRCLS